MSETDEFDFEAYRREHGLHDTDHDRIWWTTDTPHEQAWDSATTLAAEFPDLRIVGTESRVQTDDVKWNYSRSRNLLVVSYYPIRADKWDHEMIPEIREAMEEQDAR